MKQSKSSFQGLKAGALICADCFGPSKSQILGPQTTFEGYMFEDTVRDVLKIIALARATRGPNGLCS
jgi:hypothetical protein